MTTELGKELRKLRIDRNENLATMSEKLNISLSYLSAIENGTRKTPPDFIDKVTRAYQLSKEEAERLQQAATNSTDKISVSLVAAKAEQKQVAVTLSRRIKDLSTEDCRKIMELLEEHNEK